RVLPGRKAHGHVAAHDEDQLVLRMSGMQLTQGIDREGRAATIEFEPRHLEALVPGHGQLAELEANLGPRVLGDVLVRRREHRHEHDPVEAELVRRLRRAEQVREVRWVERAAEERDLQRMWPSPSTTYFVVQSSRTPMGPRACSFCVELPISAPMPN